MTNEPSPPLQETKREPGPASKALHLHVLPNCHSAVQAFVCLPTSCLAMLECGTAAKSKFNNRANRIKCFTISQIIRVYKLYNNCFLFI